MQKLFVYGTLQVPRVVSDLLGKVPKAEPAILPGYARFMLKQRNYPGVVRQANKQVDGVLYRGITAKHLNILDRYEDDIYRRQLVQVLDSRRQPVNAWAYVIPVRHKNELTRIAWDREKFILEVHLSRFLNTR